MKILGVDPGYDRCGLAVTERDARGRDSVLASGCITTSPNDAFEQRLLVVVQSFREWIVTHKPDVCVLERLYFTKNQKTAMRVAETRGALILAAHECGIPVHEYAPNQVKVAVTGNGRATKDQVMNMVQRITGVVGNSGFDDEYDAIAVALTASASLRT
jgi:crossover junction endodeoxyribonuclease RuvC